MGRYVSPQTGARASAVTTLAVEGWTSGPAAAAASTQNAFVVEKLSLELCGECVLFISHNISAVFSARDVTALDLLYMKDLVALLVDCIGLLFFS